VNTASFTTVAKQEGGEEIMDPWLFIDTTAKGIAEQPSGDGITQLQRVVILLRQRLRHFQARCDGQPRMSLQASWIVSS
jgi:hypothetical protein